MRAIKSASFLLLFSLFMLVGCEPKNELATEASSLKTSAPIAQKELPILTDVQIKNALNLGSQHIVESRKLLDIKRIRRGSDSITYMTPELNLAYAVTERELTPEDIDYYATLDEVTFFTTAEGVTSSSPSFAKAVITLEDGSILRPIRQSIGDVNIEISDYGDLYWAIVTFTFKYTDLQGKKFEFKTTDKDPFNIDFANES